MDRRSFLGLTLTPFVPAVAATSAKKEPKLWEMGFLDQRSLREFAVLALRRGEADAFFSSMLFIATEMPVGERLSFWCADDSGVTRRIYVKKTYMAEDVIPDPAGKIPADTSYPRLEIVSKTKYRTFNEGSEAYWKEQQRERGKSSVAV